MLGAPGDSTHSPPVRQRPWLWISVPVALAALAYGVFLPPSTDLAAQAFRSELFESHGFLIWNNYWYGGHYALGYSLLFPPLGAALGIGVAGGLAAVAATALFGLLAQRRYGSRAYLATLWFGAGTIAAVLSGRLTFALGVALGVAALLALSRERRVLAPLLAAATSCASPVAGFFLVLAGGALTLSGSRASGVALAAAAAAPLAFIAVFFPIGGVEPFVVSSMLGTVAVTLAVLILLPREERLLRRGALLYLLAVLCVFLVPNALGGNVVRLSNLAAGSVLALGVAGPRRTAVLAVAAVPLLYWQWQPAIRDLTGPIGDESVQRSFHAPLLAQLRMRSGEAPVRVEIPPTRHRWEARFVAPEFPLARGWERQRESKDFDLFKGDDLSARSYGSWLRSHGVGFVALADAPLDYLARKEARLIRSGLPYLRPVWANEDWRLFRVRGAARRGPDGARVTALGPDWFAARVTHAGRYPLRIRFNRYWELAGASACLRPYGDWMVLVAREPGLVEATTSFSLQLPLGREPACST